MGDVGKRKIGVNFTTDGSAQVLVWAPFAKHVQVKKQTGAIIKLDPVSHGYWELTTADLKNGDRYKFLIDGTKDFPDPASLSQPDGVHAASSAFNLNNFSWTDKDWDNLRLTDYIIYELHTGTFSEEGDFHGIEKKLEHLKNLGINAIEIMPVSQFPGTRNWGYDGVFPFAVQNSYGGPEALMHLVDKCHEFGIAVILDVVYNHIGPEGNYFSEYGPYFTDKYKTPWGSAINFDDAWCDGVRNYFIENALMWFRDFHIDALRLDAVHAIKDFSAVHILEEIRLQVDRLMKENGRTYYLIVELDLNDTRYIKPVNQGGYGMDGQWIDEFHHALRVTAGQERHGYYSDFDGIGHFAKAYTDAYVYDGQYSEHRKKKFGIKTKNHPGEQFVVFSQNHDQVGNRMLGERTSQLVSFDALKLLSAAVMLSPYLPMLFMGEEWGETKPFLYFVSHTDPELAAAVRKGRKKEFEAFHAQGEAPDPVSEQTFTQSKLNWQLLDVEPHNNLFQYYQALISLRKTHPSLKSPNRKNLSVQVNNTTRTLILFRWQENDHSMILMNFSKISQPCVPATEIKIWHKLFDSADPKWKGLKSSIQHLDLSREDVTLPPESVLIYSNNHV
jgi:maltooligosyltrehalose trehalohydrolase